MTHSQSVPHNNPYNHAQIVSALGYTGKGKRRSIKKTLPPTSFEEIAERANSKLCWSSNKIEELLKTIDADDYKTWLNVGMALHFEFEGDSKGLKIWHNYSKKSHKYEPDKLDESWQTFGKDKSRNCIKLATMIDWKNKGLHKDKSYIPPETNEEFRSSSRPISIDCFELRKKLGPINWLVKGFIERDTVGLLFGEPASYKSFIAADIAYHVATGKDWHGSEVIQGPVYCIVGEGHGGIARRQEAWLQCYDPDLSNLHVRYTTQAMDFHNEKTAQLVNHDIEEWAKTAGNPFLIVIDTLARNFNGDENSAEHMGKFINNVNEYLRAPFECVVLIVHHTGHGDKKRARGSTALKAGVDFEYRVEKDKDRSMIAKLNCTKMKDAEEPGEIWFQGRRVRVIFPEGGSEIGNGEENNCSLVFEKTDVVEQERPLTPENTQFLDLVRSLADPEGIVDRESLREGAVAEGIVKDINQARVRIHALGRKNLIEVIDTSQIRLLDRP
jgi:hypothetical protein